MKKDYQLRDRATQPQKASEAKHDSEPKSQGAIHASEATQDKPALYTPVFTVQEAIRHSLVSGFSDDSLFLYARALKAFERTHKRRLPADELAACFASWWASAKPHLPGDASYDEYRLLFLDVFSRTRFPLGANALEEAIKRSQAGPLPPEAARYYDPKLQRLVAVIIQLQRLAGDAPFILAVRDAAKIMGITNKRMTAKLLNGLVAEGTLDVVEKGVPGGKWATRYLFKFNSPVAT